ncbi:MAG TPA: hypothetical protein VEG62_08300 [Acidimicrobiales bacterium]|nr:hypothetical protein [Acidimicrobiales bacterium]
MGYELKSFAQIPMCRAQHTAIRGTPFMCSLALIEVDRATPSPWYGGVAARLSRRAPVAREHGDVRHRRHNDQPTRDPEVEDESSPRDDADDDGSSGFDHWRRESALGAVGTGLARGLQAVFAPPQDEPVVVAEAPGDPPNPDGRLRVVLDPDDPTKSVAILPVSSEPADPDR